VRERLTFLVNRDIRREALFLWIIPLEAALSILDIKPFKAGSKSPDFFLEASESNFRILVLRSEMID